ncbi:MAG: hypothetical protein JWP97_609 [Labilithrix sp.]|nr:hypothetical protein [Labilithrix sp.]
MTTVNPAAGPTPFDSYAMNNTHSMTSSELLLLFSQASNSNNTAEEGMKSRIKASIDAKSAIAGIQNDLQQIDFSGGTPDYRVGDAKKVSDGLLKAIDDCKDPGAKQELQQLYQRYFGGEGGAGDMLLNKDEAMQIGKSLDNVNSSLDDNMQMLTLNLKQSQEKFSQITNLVKDIMESNNKIFETITRR